MAFCLERLGRTEKARAQYKRATQLDGADAESCWYFIGRNYLREEKPRKAEAAFLRANRLPIAKCQLARLLMRAGDYDKSEQILADLRVRYPDAIAPYLASYPHALLDGEVGVVETPDLARHAQQRLPTPLEGKGSGSVGRNCVSGRTTC